jgi:hypothetical protein
MACLNGEQVTPKGETGVFYVCKITKNTCPFVKWCWQTNCFIDTTDRLGNTCVNFKS